MAENNQQKGNVFSANDPLDINELASLNDDISPEFIEQLQNQITMNAQEFVGASASSEKDDSELFEETKENLANEPSDSNLEDDFIKKFKAKQNKQTFPQEVLNSKEEAPESVNNENNEVSKIEEKNTEEPPKEEKIVILQQDTGNIENVSSGNIIEKPIEQQQLEYNESLDYLDDNIKYTKYVIYIDPENKDFIDSLTVKERKNIINRLLREQDDIAITKKRLGLIQTVIKHSIIAIITITIAIPVVYWTINASLEASINNYRRSQTIFKTLYKEKGKIKKNNVH